MDTSGATPMTPLDALVSDDMLQMVKTTLPYLPPKQARLLAVAAKTQELKNTLALEPYQKELYQAMDTGTPRDETMLLKDLKIYGGEKGKEMVDQLQQMQDMFQLISLMQSNQFSEEDDK